jgi:hypothetical protein
MSFCFRLIDTVDCVVFSRFQPPKEFKNYALKYLQYAPRRYAKILCEKGKLDYAYLPIIVYAPTSFAPSYISSVAKVLKTVLNGIGLMEMIYYMPDLFTYKGIYSEKGRRASIYSYPY